VSVIQAVVLGIVQGLTEFLPVSSDGHLALVYRAFGGTPDLTYEVLLHGATLLALLIYFRRDLVELLSSLLPSNKERTADRRLVALIAAGTAVSAVIALALSNVVEPLSASLTWVGVFFLMTSALMAIAEVLYNQVPKVSEPSRLGLPKAGFIGVLQGLAVLPGLSRSGSTISAGVMSGLERDEAARFSFILGIPIISLAFGKDLLDLAKGGFDLPDPLASIVGFVAAGVTGYLAIWWLLPFLKRHRLWWFVGYTAILGSVVLALGVTGRG
jgi:undecaprenyl-diphosphatase